jgi:parallel beta-helix repeat protein
MIVKVFEERRTMFDGETQQFRVMSKRKLFEKLLSVYVITALITSGLIGILVFEGVIDEGGVEAVPIIVDENGFGDYTTIQDAINGATAGATIRVWEGTYQYIVVNKALTIIGNGTTNTTITATMNARVSFTASGCNLSGFKITRTTSVTAAAVSMNNVQNIHVFDVNVTDSWYAFRLTNAHNNIIENSRINDSQPYSIHMTDSNGNEFRNNTITNSGNNINIFDSNSNIFANNTIKNCSRAVYMDGSNSNTFTGNYYHADSTTFGYRIINSNQTVIKNNKFVNRGIIFESNPLHYWFAHTITGNTLNGKPIYFWRNVTNSVVPAGAGQIILANCSNVTIKDQDLRFGARGIHAEFSDNLTIKNNIADNNFQDGIRVLDSEDLIITNNSCNSSNLGIGIVIRNLAGENRNLIKDNICNLNPRNGIAIVGSYNDIIGNTVNKTVGFEGIKIVGSHNNILNNIVESSWMADLYLKDADWNIVKNNVFIKNDIKPQVFGMYIYDSNNNIVENNTCDDNFVGINITGSTAGSNNNTIFNNSCNFNSVGISIYRGEYNKIENNSIDFNTDDGIRFGIAKNNIIHSNTINSNNRGIFSYNAVGNTFSDNTINSNTQDGIFFKSIQQSKFVFNNISNNQIGLNMYKSNDNRFHDNTISLNTVTGIDISAQSSNNLLYHNNIITNTVQASDSGSSSWYNSNLEGNYWSDYTGLDDGSGTGKHAVAGDGIGDTLVPHLSLDDYPFISKSRWWRLNGIPALNLVDINELDRDYDLTWNSMTNALGYELQEDSSLAFSSPVTAYKGPGLAVNIINKSDGEYFYRVRAYNKFFEGPWSNVVNVTVDLMPMAPENLTASNITGTEVDLTWNPNPEPDIMGYRILVNDTGASSSGPYHLLNSVAGTVTGHTVSNLVEETTYYFVVTALDNTYESPLSNVCTVTTLDESAPEPPVGLMATAVSNSEIDLTWNASTALDIAGYYIFMNESGGGPSGNFVLLNSTGGSTTSFTATGLAEEVTYYFKLTAFDEVPNNSSFSNVTSATTLDATPPAVPTGLVVTNPTFNSLTINWNANTDLDLVGYRLYRSDEMAGSFEPIFTEPFDDLEFVDTNLTVDTTYYYKLKAVDDVNLSSEFSEPASGTTLIAYPPEVDISIIELSIPEDAYDDSSLNLYDIFTDQDTNKLSFRVSGQVNISVFIYDSNGTVLLMPKPNWNGQEALTFFASDSDFPEVPHTITIIVTPVNDPPGLAQILKPNDGAEVDEGTALEFIGSCLDPDEEYGDELTFKWNSSKSGEFGTGAKLSNVTLEPGEHTITLEVSDKAGLTSTASIKLTVKGDGTTPDDGKNGDTKDTGDDGKDTGALGDNNTMLAIFAVVIIIIIALIMLIVLRKRRGAKEDEGKAEITQPSPPAEEEAKEELPAAPTVPAVPESVEKEPPKVPQLPAASPAVPPEPVQIERSMLAELPKSSPVSDEVRATAPVVLGEPVTIINGTGNTESGGP